eukprot:545058-Prorocentrum_minimum.AAC.1
MRDRPRRVHKESLLKRVHHGAHNRRGTRDMPTHLHSTCGFLGKDEKIALCSQERCCSTSRYGQ